MGRVIENYHTSVMQSEPVKTRPFELLKVSKYQKQNTKFSHPPKNQRNFVHFFALASKKWLKQKIKALDDLKGVFNTLKSFYFLIQSLFEGFLRIYKKMYKIWLVIWRMGELGILLSMFTDLKSQILFKVGFEILRLDIFRH